MDLIPKTIVALKKLEYNLDDDALEALKQAVAMSHAVTLTGVGKSFVVAQLGASLLQSVGCHAMAIHSTDLLHGGLGVVSGIIRNVVIFISHSGETSELLDVHDAIDENAGDAVITAAVTGSHQSEIAERCKISLCYRIDEDGSKHGTIPSVSVTMQLAIINSLVCGMADMMTADQLGSYHPSGMLHEKYEEIAGE